MAEPITLNKLNDANVDADTLEEFANEDKLVTSRLGAEYPSAAMASRLVVENGLLDATPFSTYAKMTAPDVNPPLVDGDYTVVSNDADIAKNGIYEKVSGAWVYSKYNYTKMIELYSDNQLTTPIDELNKYVDTVVVSTDITAIRNLGFNKVAEGNANRPFLNVWIDLKKDDYFCVRLYVYTAIANAFGTPRVYWWNKNTRYHNQDLILDKKISDNIAIFRLSDKATRTDINKMLIGIDLAVTGSDVKLFGLQFATSQTPIVSIKDNSYPQQTASPQDLANSIANRAIADLQLPTAKYNTKIIYGQSLAAGNESWPSLSKTNKFGNLMLGDNVRPSANDGDTYPTFGTATLKPLAASVVSASGGAIVSDADVKTLPTGHQAIGEPVNHGFLNAAKHYLNQKMLTANDESRLFVTITPAVAGRTIEQLSKVNTQDGTNRYGRFIDGLSKVVAAATPNTHVVDSIVWMQGEYNYKNHGGSYDKSSYKTALNTLINNMQADAVALTSQSQKPVLLTYQTSGSYTVDVDSAGKAGLHVGMAQLEVSNTRDDTFMFAPTYPYTDKGGHLDSNGYRWMGNKIAQVYKHVVLDGKNWSPLQPIKITQNGKKIRIDFYVPVPPLQFGRPYVGNVTEYYANKGFKITDSSGVVDIAEVFVFDTHVEILTTVVAGLDASVWYASATNAGNGNLCDSDNTVAFDQYEYIADSGMYASANIAELVNKPYPLQNWCVAFYLPVNYTYAP